MKNVKPTFKDRVFGCLLGEGADAALVAALKSAVQDAGGTFKTVAPRVGGVVGDDGQTIAGDYQLDGAPSVLFDAVAVVAGQQGAQALSQHAKAIEWVRDAFSHLKVMGVSSDASVLGPMAGVDEDKGVISLALQKVNDFIGVVEAGRIWEREPNVRPV